MTRYKVPFKTSAFTYVTVQADSLEEATEKSEYINEFPELCAQCAGMFNFRNGILHSGVELAEWELDGDIEES